MMPIFPLTSNSCRAIANLSGARRARAWTSGPFVGMKCFNDVSKDERSAQFAETGVDKHHFRVVHGDGAAVCSNERVATSTSPVVA